MKPVHIRLHNQLEKRLGSSRSQWWSYQPSGTSGPKAGEDPEVETLVALAQGLQSAGPLQVDPTFARRLEDRMLVHYAVQTHEQAIRTQRNVPLLAGWQVRLVLGAVLLCLLLGSGVLTAAAHITNPTNPLYAVKRWEQQVQTMLTPSAVERAEQEKQIAYDQLSALASLADPAHARRYQQALVDLHQQIQATAEVINTVPTGKDRDRLSSELQRLRADARLSLRSLLPRLTIAEQLATTQELGWLDARVPSLKRIEVTLSLHPSMLAMISVSGDGLQTGLRLLLDGQPVTSAVSYRSGSYMFVVNWAGKRAPHMVGILNPDGTGTQTTQFALTVSESNNVQGKDAANGNGAGNGNTDNGLKGNGNGGSNSHGHGPTSGNGNSAGKPASTPTPRKRQN